MDLNLQMEEARAVTREGQPRPLGIRRGWSSQEHAGIQQWKKISMRPFPPSGRRWDR
jgi:hypothetical protein